jgi:hypothetical protein
VYAMCKNILIVRTHYPHWAKHSGYHQFIKYICPTRFLLDVQVVDRRNNYFPVSNAKLRPYVDHVIRKFTTQAYDLNNLVAEMVALRKLTAVVAVHISQVEFLANQTANCCNFSSAPNEAEFSLEF